MSKKSRKPRVQKTAFGEMAKIFRSKSWNRSIKSKEGKSYDRAGDFWLSTLAASRSIEVNAEQAVAAALSYKRGEVAYSRMPFQSTFFHFRDSVIDINDEHEEKPYLGLEAILILDMTKKIEEHNRQADLLEAYDLRYRGNDEDDPAGLVGVAALVHTSEGKQIIAWAWGDREKYGELPDFIFDEIELIPVAVMTMLSSVNVDLEPRQSFPRGHVAHHAPQFEVVIRQTARRPGKASSEPQEMHYTHRFERRGHFKHHFELTKNGTTNKIFAAWARDKPDKLLEIDGKPCVRIWNREAVVGPSDKPLIPKLRRVA